MGDSVHMRRSDKFFGQKLAKPCLRTYRHITSTDNLKYLKNLKLDERPSGQVILFLLKVVALDIVRRFSKRWSPFVWNGLQSLQVLTYPPFKLIQKWKPFNLLIKGLQVFSKPLLFLSVVTVFSEYSYDSKKISDDATNVDNSQLSEYNISQTTSNARISNEIVESAVASGDWLVKLRKDLEHHGAPLPDRITDDELYRFHTAADGDFLCLLDSIKRTIRWRATYTILKMEELETWSPLVFWHGTDVELHHCLVIRLGLACSTIVPHDRPRFTQAIVSQIEHGVVSFGNTDDPRFTVVMDCEGILPVGFPSQMMRSCSGLMQAHYPNRLATLLVIKLPPESWELMQTFFQVLKPITQQKVQIEGEESYKKVLASFLKSVPSFLGGNCKCSDCCAASINTAIHSNKSHSRNNKSDKLDGSSCDRIHNDVPYDSNYEQGVRAALVGLLMIWIFFAILLGMQDSANYFL